MKVSSQQNLPIFILSGFMSLHVASLISGDCMVNLCLHCMHVLLVFSIVPEVHLNCPYYVVFFIWLLCFP